MSNVETPTGVVVLTVVCTHDDPRAFCSALTGAVRNSSWMLTRAFAVARQVHPQHPEAVGTLATLMHCEFRILDDCQGISDGQIDDLLTRLSGFETFGLQRPTTSSPLLPTVGP